MPERMECLIRCYPNSLLKIREPLTECMAISIVYSLELGEQSAILWKTLDIIQESQVNQSIMQGNEASLAGFYPLIRLICHHV